MFDGVDTAVRPFYVEPAQIMTWAARVHPHLEKMGEGSNGRYLGADILTAIAAGRMQLWLGLQGVNILFALLTDVQQYPRCRAMRLIGLVGVNPTRWRHVLAAIERSAKDDFGCDMMEAFHPPRYRVLVPGYQPTHIFAEKRL